MTFDSRSSLDSNRSGVSLAARLYAIFGLFAVLTAAIALLSDYNSRKSRELTDAIETANTAALNVERVNGLVYAVVMDSRGVYMSDKPDVVRKYGDGILKFNDQILAVVQKWQAIVRSDDAEQFATFKKRIEQFVDFRKELVRRGIEIGPAAGREWGDNDANRSVRQALNKDLDALAKVYAERGKTIGEQAAVNRELSFLLTCLGGVALILVVIGVIIIARSIARPLSQITSTIKQVAEGADQVEVPHVKRADEIGALARAIRIFQEAMMRRYPRTPMRERSAPGTSRRRSKNFSRRSEQCCRPSRRMPRRCARRRRISLAPRRRPTAVLKLRPAPPRRRPRTSPPLPARPKNFRRQ
jgi:methyl-accepting chemotaxis protein